MKQIEALTGLRGLAALMIFAVHASTDGLLPDIIDGGYNKPSILLFFILSGYLITSIYFNKDFNSSNLKSFLKARTARIWPLYITMLIASLLITNFIYPAFHYNFSNLTKFILALFMLNSPYEAWTIPVEFQLYILFVLVWFLSKKLNKSFFTMAAIISAISIIITFAIAASMHKFPRIMPTFAFYFLAGGAISQITNQNTSSERDYSFQLIAGRIVFFVLLLFPLIKVYAGFLFFGGWYDPFMMLIVVSAFYFIAKQPESFYLLNNKVMIFAGKISYGFYLSHRPIMKFFVSHFGTNTSITLVVFLLSIAAGYLTYISIEMPGKKLISGK